MNLNGLLFDSTVLSVCWLCKKQWQAHSKSLPAYLSTQLPCVNRLRSMCLSRCEQLTHSLLSAAPFFFLAVGNIWAMLLWRLPIGDTHTGWPQCRWCSQAFCYLYTFQAIGDDARAQPLSTWPTVQSWNKLGCSAVISLCVCVGDWVWQNGSNAS